MAGSWGGHESLIMPAIASISDKDFDPGNPAHRRVRFYVGLEDADYIIEDLERGFNAVKKG
jgi:cystathionine beta-lyase/cystathionine gamma-synthase